MGRALMLTPDSSSDTTATPQINDAALFDPWDEEAELCSVDTPFGCMPGLERFKQMVREDYYMAEALWAGVFCSLMVTVAMQMVKAYIVATLPAPPPFPM